MFTGIAVLGVLAGSLVSLFTLDPGDDEKAGGDATASELEGLRRELIAVEGQLGTVETRLAELLDLAWRDVPEQGSVWTGPGDVVRLAGCRMRFP